MISEPPPLRGSMLSYRGNAFDNKYFEQILHTIVRVRLKLLINELPSYSCVSGVSADGITGQIPQAPFISRA